MEVSSEYWLNVKCAYPDKQLFDWGMMRLRRPPYGVGDPFAIDAADDQIRKKRDTEVIFYFTDQCPSSPFGLNQFSCYGCYRLWFAYIDDEALLHRY